MAEINYYSENSDATWAADSPPIFTEASRPWRPGLAGPFERVAMGSADGDGWFLYFLMHSLVLEVWAGGEWQFTRTLDCSRLLSVRGTRHRHLVAFGYDLERSVVSLGVVTRDKDDLSEAASVYVDHVVAGLRDRLAHPPRIYLGGMPVTLSGGGEQGRTLGADIRPVHGRVAGRTPMSRGEFARLSSRELISRD